MILATPLRVRLFIPSPHCIPGFSLQSFVDSPPLALGFRAFVRSSLSSSLTSSVHSLRTKSHLARFVRSSLNCAAIAFFFPRTAPPPPPRYSPALLLFFVTLFALLRGKKFPAPMRPFGRCAPQNKSPKLFYIMAHYAAFSPR